MSRSVNIFQRIPFIRIVSLFVIGVISSKFFPLRGILGAIVIFLFLCLFVAFLLKTNFHSVIVANDVLVGLLVFSGNWMASQRVHQQDELPPQRTFYSATVLERPVEKAKSYQTVLRLRNPEKKIQGKVIAYFSKEIDIAELYPGRRMIAFIQADSIENRGNPYEFDYAAYRQQQGISYSVYLRPNDFRILDATELGVAIFSRKCRDYLLSVLRKANVAGEEYTVIAALTLGDKKELDRETKNCFSSTGAMHVLAVSGLHVGIIYFIFGFLFAPLKRFKYGRPVFLLVVSSLIWMYALLTGFSPSVQRAAVMFSFILIGENLKRTANIFNSLAASAFLLVVAHPLIIYNVGFQLSYLAVTGIVLFQPLLYRKLVFKAWLPDKMWALFTVSLAAQLATFPIAIGYFSQFPVYFWLSNFVVIPAATCIMCGTFLLFVFSFVPVFPVVMGYLLQGLTHGMLFLLKGIDALPFSLIRNISISPLQMVLLFLTIAFAYWFIAEKSISELRLSFVALAVFFLVLLVNNIQLVNQEKVIIYNAKYPVIHCVKGANNYVVYDALNVSDDELHRLIDPVIGRLKLNHPRIIELPSKEGFQNEELMLCSNMINFIGHKIQLVTDPRKWVPACRHVVSSSCRLSGKTLEEDDCIVVLGRTKVFKQHQSGIYRTSKEGAYVFDFKKN